MRHAAELHDVGKVAIPDAILNKPGPLDPLEWEFIRRHTLIGERIIAAAPALGPVAALVRSSHERWDGAGYPDKLTEQQIPVGSRIVAVADAFDAMTAERPYNAAMTPELALSELRRCAGTQFDPVVVDAFCEAWTELRTPAPACVSTPERDETLAHRRVYMHNPGVGPCRGPTPRVGSRLFAIRRSVTRHPRPPG